MMDQPVNSKPMIANVESIPQGEFAWGSEYAIKQTPPPDGGMGKVTARVNAAAAAASRPTPQRSGRLFLLIFIL